MKLYCQRVGEGAKEERRKRKRRAGSGRERKRRLRKYKLKLRKSNKMMKSIMIKRAIVMEMKKIEPQIKRNVFI